MARTSNIFARVEPELKEQAEQVLSPVGDTYVQCGEYVSPSGGFAERHSL